jgi:hypothetical protein
MFWAFCLRLALVLHSSNYATLVVRIVGMKNPTPLGSDGVLITFAQVSLKVPDVCFLSSWVYRCVPPCPA